MFIIVIGRRQEEKVKYRGRGESGEVKCSCKYWFQVRKVCKVNIIKNLLTTNSIKLIFQNTCKMEEGSFSDSQGRKLKTFTWTPSQPPRALVFLSHG